eukprot:gene6041-biopygen13367
MYVRPSGNTAKMNALLAGAQGETAAHASRTRPQPFLPGRGAGRAARSRSRGVAAGGRLSHVSEVNKQELRRTLAFAQRCERTAARARAPGAQMIRMGAVSRTNVSAHRFRQFLARGWRKHVFCTLSSGSGGGAIPNSGDGSGAHRQCSFCGPRSISKMVTRADPPTEGLPVTTSFVDPCLVGLPKTHPVAFRETITVGNARVLAPVPLVQALAAIGRGAGRRGRPARSDTHIFREREQRQSNTRATQEQRQSSAKQNKT